MIRLKNYPIAYWPVPKVACSSIKSALWALDRGRPMLRYNDEGEVHSLFPTHYFEPIKEKNIYKFAVIRDPIDRLLSAYRHRVVDSHEMEDPGIKSFIQNLERYRFEVYQIKHHTDPQVLFIGNDARYFDRLFLFEELTTMPAEIEKATGAKMELRHEMRSKPLVITLQKADRDLLMQFYKDDYNLLDQARRAAQA